MATDDPLQTWELVVDGRAHRVEVHGSVRRRIRWWVDGDLVLDRRSAEDKPRLRAPDHPDHADLGTLALRFSGLGKPRRATVLAPGDLTGVDLAPEAGSPAAAYEERVRDHPRRHALLATVGGVAAVVVPILVTLLLARLAFRIDWPDLPFPDLPDLPDLPSVPLPDIPLPDVSLPGWVNAVLDKATYVWPIALAFVLARAEVRRRASQDRLRAERRGAGEDGQEGPG